jgi:DNA mismatch repair endonuclease MutH
LDSQTIGSTFDPATADEAEIMARAALLEGQTLGELEDLTPHGVPVAGKGSAGLMIERFFGITANSLSAPDFPRAGIELKVVPVVTTAKGGRRIKERTVISMIDYPMIVGETWQTAHVRRKLDLLLVFYKVKPKEPLSDFPIVRALRWRPQPPVDSLLEHDWEAIKTKVVAGRAEDLTESEGYVLGACTKGPGGGVSKSQPNSSALAPGRAFALKPSFTLNLLLDAERNDLPELRRLDDLQRRYQRFVGSTVGAMAEVVGLPSSRAKNWAARVVRKGVGVAAGLEIEDLGLTVRVPRVDPALRPYEAISFPSFRHKDLVDEDWNDSLLLSYLEYMLFAPTMGQTRDTLPNRCIVTTPVYWTPTPDELSMIREEWTMFRDLIRAGRADRLPTAAKTRAIHIRTKGRDSHDLDELPDGSLVTKKAFWLNVSFVHDLLKRYSA